MIWRENTEQGNRIPAFVVVSGGCWFWTRSVNLHGYAREWKWGPDYGKMMHNLVWSSLTGQEIPKGLQLDHLCLQTRCVNPEHLELVTAVENRFRQKNGGPNGR